mmetsp:Transcript_24646/g.69301  ORF Transcript_24646/g.69301 Transcript_24646/m.69301 type:complete len:444 (-) Transcript_24646:679-2010(-)
MRPLRMSLYTQTSFCWPIRKARSTACASDAGFQAGSTMITRSAPVRLRPTPPTWVVSSMHWKRSGCSWNFATFTDRSDAGVAPSMRRHRSPVGFRQHIWMRSSIFTLCEKTSMRWPRDASAGSRALRQRSLQLCIIMASASRGSFFRYISAARPARESASSPSGLPPADSVEAAASMLSRSMPSFSSCPAVHSDSRSLQSPALGVGSSSIGWLQRRFSRPIARNTSTPSLVFAHASRMTSLFSRIFWYAEICSSVGVSQMIISFLGTSRLLFSASAPSSSSAPMSSITTSALPSAPTTRPALTFVRRMMWGLIMVRSCSARCFFSWTANGVAPRTLPRSIGSQNFFTKVAWLPSSPGCAKSISDHRSWSAFCTGVPVRRTRHLEWTLRSDFPRSVEMVLITWASSQMTTSQAFSQGSPPSRFFAAPSPNTGLARGSATDTFSR